MTGNAGATVTTRFEYVVAGDDGWTTITGCGNATGATRARAPGSTSGAEVYDVRAVAVIGSQTFYDTQADVKVDNVVPTITSPCPGGHPDRVGRHHRHRHDADTGVDGVTFEYKHSPAPPPGPTCGVDTDAPYSCHLVTSSWPNGCYDFRSTATDLAGNTTTTTTVTRTVDNTAPSVSISAPSAGAVITSGSTTVTADAFAVAGVTSVRIEARTGAAAFAAICTDDSAPYSCPWSTSALASGTWDLRAVMTHGRRWPADLGHRVTVTVDNAGAKAQDVQAVNAARWAAADVGDQIVLTYSTLVNPATIKSRLEWRLDGVTRHVQGRRG